ncbi:probable phosphorylase b kinase regulatory subunit alpha isoform X1 [Littorina saxatilis]|uniref:probable phosphorylase b kinase regulatory subunit alpha isoform X1 n=1 Tax=Littorina saxatilis TaxID=31220 RepID=UPI0038B434FA
MRNRSGSGIRLDYFQRLVNRSILKYQNPATGLIASRHDIEHSWVRDNVYSILSVWGLALAYKKTADLDEDRAKAYELQNAVVMLMRGLLRSMMMQSDKLEKFKKTQSPTDALHAKYCTRTGKTVVGDNEWGHLQIDATSLYLLTLAQMTASGLNIIFTLDEVAFVQNLVFYIETAYRTPDYGIWERGDKTNHGLPELNSSSIGMAKAALEAINELDLFAARGGPASVIYVMPDEAQQCQAILTSMLPRESSSKEVDASLLTVIGFPAFAMDDLSVIKATRDLIHSKLEGKYGCIRFLRDGYKTPREDPNRLYYEPSELMQFENIESQWPIFFALYHLNGLFRNDKEQADKYRQKLDEVMLKTDDGIPYMPELYAVPAEVVHEEIEEKNSQKRVPRGQKPHMWGQSLYILGRLMSENFLSPGELDPLNRRLIREDKPDVVVQVAILAEDAEISHALAKHGIHVQTISQSYPIQVHPARVLSQIFSRLGKSKRLGLSGRPSGEIGLLATSKLYMLDNKIFAFIPQFIDAHQFYMSWDVDFLVDQFQTDMDFLARSWTMLGRPLILFLVSNTMLDYSREMPSALIGTLKKLQSGYISGTRVHMGKLSDFLTTSCMTQLDFLRDQDDPSQKEGNVLDFIDTILSPSCPRPHLLAAAKRARKTSRSVSGQAIYGIVRRSRSIQIDSEQIPDMLTHLNARMRAGSVSQGSSNVTCSSTERIHAMGLQFNQTKERKMSPGTSNPLPQSQRGSLDQLNPLTIQECSGSVPSSNLTSTETVIPAVRPIICPIEESFNFEDSLDEVPKIADVIKESDPVYRHRKYSIVSLEDGTPAAFPTCNDGSCQGPSFALTLHTPGDHQSRSSSDDAQQGRRIVYDAEHGKVSDDAEQGRNDSYDAEHDTKASYDTLQARREWYNNPRDRKTSDEMHDSFSGEALPSLGLGKVHSVSDGARKKRSSVVHVVSQYGYRTFTSDMSNADQKLQLKRMGQGSLENARDCSCTIAEKDSENNFQHLRTAVSMHHSHSMTLSGHHNISIPQGNEVNVHELLENLKQSDSLQEQADIIHYLYTHKGPDWDTGIDSQRKCTVRDLLTELYEKAGHWKQWWLVRHTAGMLKKRVEDLAIAATDLVVRQKQLSVGMPPYGEHIITCPLPPDELASIIFNAYAEDSSSASLTQELLIYLAMFIRTEPKLFSEMLRLRVGLIIQVMASEMSRTLQCTGEEASDHLLNLSPFEMKTLLHHILSGKEFHISAIKGQKPAKDVKETLKGESREKKLSIVSRHNKNEVKDFARLSTREKVVSQRDLDLISAPAEPESKKDKGDDRQGQWLRRRRLDGALNRVPVGFYPRIWKVLRRCQGLKIDETTLYRSLTEEMTEGEFKFALEVEIVLNQIPEPEYRQLMVEAMMILATMVENDNCKINMDQIILVDHIVTEANRIYVETQKIPPDILNNCMGARGICFHLYDSAPSGPHGTMTYMCRALARLFNLPVQNGDLECTIS